MSYEKNEAGLLVPSLKQRVIGYGRYSGTIIRVNGDIEEFETPNITVNEGLNDLLSVYLAGGSQKTAWYLGIFSGNYTPVSTDTAATIASSATESSAYSGGTRPQWNPGAVSSQSVSNSSNRATYTFTGFTTIYGAFLISNATINGTSGVLFSAAQFGASKAVSSGDQLLVTYTFTSASA